MARMNKTTPNINGHARWNTLLLAGVAITLGGLFSREARASIRWETLEAIHAIENPYNRSAPGPCGELGAYQFRLDTWRMHSRRPFNEALDRHCSDEVAVRHYDWLKGALERKGLESSIYNIALAWNAGLGAVMSGRVPAVSRDYATRVENIATELHSRQRQLADAR